jgi:hypothetical protein
MIETGAYGERMAGYLHLTEPPIHRHWVSADPN